VIVGDQEIDPELNQMLTQTDVPVLRQYDEPDYLTAVDEFFDTVHVGKSVLVD
jgi:hypothetical protein